MTRRADHLQHERSASDGDKAGAEVVFPRGYLFQADSVELSQLVPIHVEEGFILDGAKLCYLDPPFNTGERFGFYADSMSSEDWFDWLVERLEVVRGLLHPLGSVWLHLDDSEQHRGRLALDRVFGTEAFVSTIIWQKKTSRDNRKAFSSSHDYIHVYAPAGPKAWKVVRNGLPNAAATANPDADERGPWRSVPLSVQAGHGTASQFYDILSPAGTLVSPPAGRCWAYSKPRFEQLQREGRIYWPRNGHGIPRLKKYEFELADLAPSTLWLADEVGSNSQAKKDLLRMFPGMSVFDTPKPESLMERIVGIATSPGDLVLDRFLGSGATAVVASRMQRRWLGVEKELATVETMVKPRLDAAKVDYIHIASESIRSIIEVAG